MNDELDMPRVRRRRHSAKFKNQVINACLQLGVSIAATALRYGLNANLVRIWIRAHERIRHESEPVVPVASIAAFVPINLPLPARPSEPRDIVIEIRRGTASVTVRWTGVAAEDCGNWF
jgi:transposase-like protein